MTHSQQSKIASIAQLDSNVVIGNQQGSQYRNRATRHIPYPEYVRRREEGRCFRCGQPYSPTHRCPERKLRVLILGEDEETTKDGEFEVAELIKGERDQEPQGETPECNYLDLPFFSINGFSRPKTMKMKGNIGEHSVIVLVDSGASHNFISETLANNLGLPISETGVFVVKLGDGRQISSAGMCKQIKLLVNGVSIVADFHLFNLGGVDVILGISWLETLGEVKLNWRTLCMSFEQNGKKMSLQGDPSLCKT